MSFRSYEIPFRQLFYRPGANWVRDTRSGDESRFNTAGNWDTYSTTPVSSSRVVVVRRKVSISVEMGGFASNLSGPDQYY